MNSNDLKPGDEVVYQDGSYGTKYKAVVVATGVHRIGSTRKDGVKVSVLNSRDEVLFTDTVSARTIKDFWFREQKKRDEEKAERERAARIQNYINEVRDWINLALSDMSIDLRVNGEGLLIPQVTKGKSGSYDIWNARKDNIDKVAEIVEGIANDRSHYLPPIMTLSPEDDNV